MTYFIRHIRPVFACPSRMELLPKKSGGLSVLIHPSAQGVYDFWIYFCPLDTPFSAKVAKHSLVRTFNKGVKPWGTFNKTDEKITLSIIKEVLLKRTGLPSEVPSELQKMVVQNNHEKSKLHSMMPPNSRPLYMEDSIENHII